MSHAAPIHPHHLNRTALVYVRQSTAKQLVQHPESTRRQYQLAERAAALGWPQPRIQIIDDDLGRSGAHSSGREGFQRLVAAISLGEVGLVLVTEVSRLSRLNSDWQRVLELCAVFDTLIADDDGLYDPRDPNDRLVLGLKGTLFAAELHILRARMRGGLLNKARRGALALRLPVGYRRLRDGSVVLDPDEQVRTTLRAPLYPVCSGAGSACSPAVFLDPWCADAALPPVRAGCGAGGLGAADLPDDPASTDQSGLRRSVCLRPADPAGPTQRRPQHAAHDAAASPPRRGVGDCRPRRLSHLHLRSPVPHEPPDAAG